VETTTPVLNVPRRADTLPYFLPVSPSFDDFEAASAVFLARVYDGRHPHTMSMRVRGGLDPFELLPEGFVVERSHESSYRRVVSGHSEDDSVGLLILAGPGVTVIELSAAHADSLEPLSETFEPYRRVVDSTQFLNIRFWYDGAHGPESRERSLDCANWDEVEHNYPISTRGSLAQLMALRRPLNAGSLILWHGAPGTGKTNAVRSLAKNWSSWTTTHVITDPECFFEHPSYLLEVMLSAPERTRADSTNQWLLIVCEDADEYLTSDARQRSGTALGRLLNATDGLLGRGLGALVLLTTNEDAGRLHPSVTRAGRCLASVEFAPFTPLEVTEWLGDEGHVASRSMTLADLYELRSDTPRLREPEPRFLTGAYL
jgi:hypothetical protein